MAFRIETPERELLTAKSDLVITTGVVKLPNKRPMEMRLKKPILLSAGTKVVKHYEKNGTLMFRLVQEGNQTGGILTHPSSDFMKEDLSVMEQKFTDDAKAQVEESKKKNIIYFFLGGAVGGGIAFFGFRNSKYKDKLWLLVVIAFILGGGLTMFFLNKKKNGGGEVKPANPAAPESKFDDDGKKKEVEKKADSKDEMDKLMTKLREEHSDISFEDEHKFRQVYSTLSQAHKELARDFISGTVGVAKDLIKVGEKDSQAYSKAIGQLEDALKIKFGAAEVDQVMSKFEAIDWRKKK